MRKFIALLLFLSSILSVYAKLTQFIVRGYVVEQDYSKADWRRESVDSVFVALVCNDTVPVSFKMLNGDDELKMTTAGELRILAQGGVGSYSLILNRDGYEPLRHDFKVVSEGQDVVYVRSLSMEKKRENTLNEVEVVGTAIKMVMKGDTIVYDSRAFKLAEGSTLDALVRQLPGAQLSDDGSITVNGKKVSSLLLDGNDFFQGDPEIALKNLPAYTVDKIKVYDKAAKDDAVTLASQTLTDSPEDENLVMDVTLKKEFQMATIINVEGGYGPGIYPKENPKSFDHRYLGRAFAIGFGKKYRFSVFGSYNNINNFSKASSGNKDWGWNWNPNGGGDAKVAIGGVDVFYNPTKKFEISADLTYQRSDNDYRQLRSETSFFTTGNLYRRSSQQQTSCLDNVAANVSLRYMGDRVSVRLYPNVRWERRNAQNIIMSATYSRNPAESYRGAAIDSLFSRSAARPESERYVTSSSYRASNSGPDLEQLSWGGIAILSWRPEKARGVFYLSASGNDVQNKKRSGLLLDQPFLADPSVTPLRRQQWDDKNNRNSNFGTNLNYEWEKKVFGDRHINSFAISPAVGYDLARERDHKVMTAERYLEGLDPGARPLPSVTAPENIRPLIDFDANNTYTTLDLSNEMLGRLNLNWTIEPAAPGDSTFNPRFGAHVSFDHRQYWRHYTQSKPYADPQLHFALNRCDPTENINVNLSLSSNNKRDYLSIYASYRYSTSLLGLSTLVPTMSDSDPLHVYLGPEGGEKFLTPYSHYAALYFNYYGNQSHKSASFNANYSKNGNLTAQTSVFDPATGITTHRPITVNGNWDFDLGANFQMPFGPLECWQWGVSVDYNHENSVDYVSSVGQPLRSLVESDRLHGRGGISYKIKNGTTFEIGAGTTWQHAISPRTDFNAISAWGTELHASINFFLPWNIQGQTSLDANIRRGYEDMAMNTTEWVWNASVQKSLLDGALTFKLNAVDILGQLSNIHYNVNAQGRVETWTNSLPRYVMLTVAYRFNFTPKALK